MFFALSSSVKGCGAGRVREGGLVREIVIFLYDRSSVPG
jgi:hypothetical protein